MIAQKDTYSPPLSPNKLNGEDEKPRDRAGRPGRGREVAGSDFGSAERRLASAQVGGDLRDNLRVGTLRLFGLGGQGLLYEPASGRADVLEEGSEPDVV